MDKKSKFLIVIFVVVILVSIFFTYKRSFLDRDFIILESEELAEDEMVGESEEFTDEEEVEEPPLEPAEPL